MDGNEEMKREGERYENQEMNNKRKRKLIEGIRILKRGMGKWMEE